MQQQAAPKQET